MLYSFAGVTESSVIYLFPSNKTSALPIAHGHLSVAQHVRSGSTCVNNMYPFHETVKPQGVTLPKYSQVLWLSDHNLLCK